jgi:hypothetical protein
VWPCQSKTINSDLCWSIFVMSLFLRWTLFVMGVWLLNVYRRFLHPEFYISVSATNTFVHVLVCLNCYRTEGLVGISLRVFDYFLVNCFYCPANDAFRKLQLINRSVQKNDQVWQFWGSYWVMYLPSCTSTSKTAVPSPGKCVHCNLFHGRRHCVA